VQKPSHKMREFVTALAMAVAAFGGLPFRPPRTSRNDSARE
jgi:hypothetical protein